MTSQWMAQEKNMLKLTLIGTMSMANSIHETFPQKDTRTYQQHHTLQPPRQSAPTHATKLWSQIQMAYSDTSPVIWQRPTKTPPTATQNSAMVWMRHQQHNNNSTQYTFLPSSQVH